ncbi:MAG: protein translocase subunit SecF [bacterium]
MASPFFREKNIIDVVKFRWLWIGISLVLIIPGLVAMIYSSVHYSTHAPFKLGIDFTGGSLIQYGVKSEIKNTQTGQIKSMLEKEGIDNPVVQIEGAGSLKNADSDLKKGNKSGGITSIVTIRTRFLETQGANNEINNITKQLNQKYGDATLLQVNQIGPTLGKELFINAGYTLLLAFAAIVLYLGIRFSFDYAVFALFALLHDALFVCGMFSIFGLFFNTEIDSLFITAILTVVGFSVHDTIVVFDRIRENSRFLAKKMTFNEVVNASVNQTLARSINTSLTALLTLLALYFFGGQATRDFVLAMALGIFIGTYSSIFNASTLLAMWRNRAGAKKVRTLS